MRTYCFKCHGESGLRQFVELKEGFCYGRPPPNVSAVRDPDANATAGADSDPGGAGTDGDASESPATCEQFLRPPLHLALIQPSRHRASRALCSCEQLLLKPNAWPNASVATERSIELTGSPNESAVGEAWRQTLLGFLEARAPRQPPHHPHPTPAPTVIQTLASAQIVGVH